MYMVYILTKNGHTKKYDYFARTVKKIVGSERQMEPKGVKVQDTILVWERM